jgi:LemA protein
MSASRIRLGARGLGVLASVWLSGCGYNALQSEDARVESAWSELVAQYRERAALVPNLVNVVRGYVPQERSLLEGVSDAETKALGIPVTSKLLDDPRLLGEFQAAQNGLASALSRLVAVSDKYPDLKSDQNFRDAESSLEASEEKISAARRHYADTVREYNQTVRMFPEKVTASLLGFKSKADLAVPNLPVIVRPPEAPESPPAAPEPSRADPGEPQGAPESPPPPSAPDAAPPPKADGGHA